LWYDINMENRNRKSIRIKSWDYSNPSDYFVTICTKDRENLFGEIVDEEMVLNEIGKIAEQCWLEIPKHFSNTELDIFQIMPNHAHFVLRILCGGNIGPECRGLINQTPTEERDDGPIVGATLAVAQNNRAGASPAPTLGNIVGAFKSLCFKKYKKYVEQNNLNFQTKFWQRNYYEEIIKNEKHYGEVYNYILSNPSKWDEDRNNPKNIEKK